MMTERVPGQLAEYAVILMQIVASMREDDIRSGQALQLLEGLFDFFVLRRKVGITKFVRDYTGTNRMPKEALRTRAKLSRPYRRRAEHYPGYVRRTGPLKQFEQRRAATDVYVVAM